MTFFIDNQTLNDLELFPIRGRADSIFDCYNCTETKGGSEVLHKYFRFPVADIEFLEQRKQQIIFFFKCFETVLKNEMAEYDYKLKNGISSERLGLKIIESENIKAILESVVEQQQVNTEKIDRENNR